MYTNKQFPAKKNILKFLTYRSVFADHGSFIEFERATETRPGNAVPVRYKYSGAQLVYSQCGPVTIPEVAAVIGTTQ